MTKDIQKAVGRMQVLKFHPVVCDNISPLFKWEMDVMSISKSGMLYEFEVKISRSDFKADSKKNKDYFYADGLATIWAPNFFNYVCPTDLIKPEEIHQSFGLYYYDGVELTEIKKAKRLHEKIHDKGRIADKVLRLQQERIFLGCARMTYNNKQFISPL